MILRRRWSLVFRLSSSVSLSAVRRLSSVVLLSVVYSLSSVVYSLSADYPSWWTNRNVIIPSAVTNDYAAVNAGQLKWVAVQAKAEMDAKLPGGAGSNVNNMINSFTSSNNYYAVNAGQLKNVAAPFWARLIEVGYTNAYPWPVPPVTNANDFALVNIGQLKNVFSFDLLLDTDADGLPDWWEMKWFGSLNQTGYMDTDHDGVCNFQEYINGTNPNETGYDPSNKVYDNTTMELTVYRVITAIPHQNVYIPTGTTVFTFAMSVPYWAPNYGQLYLTSAQTSPGGWSLTGLGIRVNGTDLGAASTVSANGIDVTPLGNMSMSIEFYSLGTGSIEVNAPIYLGWWNPTMEILD